MKQFVKPINVLLIFVPVAVILELAHGAPVLIFVISALAVVPLSGLLGDATEELASRTGPRVGALLNATLGNAAELIITILAIKEGLLELVRASIIGSVIGNLLLVAGVAIIAGGLKHGQQRFETRSAVMNSTLLVMAAFALALPSFFNYAIEPNGANVESLSLLTAGVIIIMYVLSMIYSLTARDAEPIARPSALPPEGSVWLAVAVLAGATVLIALVSEFLVGAVEPMVQQLGISELFVGIILVPIIGNVAEHVVAIEVAMKNHMDLSMGIALGSSLQVALFVAPLLVFISLLFGHPLSLEFTTFEVAALLASCFISAHVAVDGETNWLEGVLLVSLYLVMAAGFFFLPAK
ncbi:MAG: calcium/proton exchanger [Chloroflexi bacterium]|nr:calcium/proton exchanger [Chloroflexota bacterium]MCL5274432.1 calcium/proton exchanger [Chloroflexota bacterium]